MLKLHWRVDLSRIALDMQRVNKGLLLFYGLKLGGCWLGVFHRRKQDV